MKTIHFSDQGKSYPRKKPQLRFDILECLALMGHFSQSTIKKQLKRRHYPDLVHAFKTLKDNDYIEIAFSKSGRGKKEIFYKISIEGIKFLLTDRKDDIERFWRVLISYSLERDIPVKAEEVDEIYDYFIRGFFNYLGRYEYFLSQLDIFNDMCINWIFENHRTKGTSLAQKIFEILALTRSLTLEELASKASASVTEIERELASYTYKENPNDNPFFLEDELDEAHYDRDALNQRIAEWMRKTTIISNNQNNGVTTYSLSIYGLMLVFTLLRYYESKNKVKELYLFNKNDILLKDSFDNIINVHKDSLPLIFGKWNLLKFVLKIVSVYAFDVIIDKDTRAMSMNTSVVLGGNKEFYDGIHGIAEYSRRKLHKFHHIGMGVYQEFSKKGNIDKINEVYNKLSEISILLGYARSRNMSMPVNEAKGISSKTLFSSKTVGSILERAMVYEITALYYMVLNQEFFSPLQFTAPNQFYVILQELPIKKRLFNLLNRSVELEQFFSRLSRDCIMFHTDAGSMMENSLFSIQK